MERRTLLVEGAHRHRDADHAEKPAVLVEDGGGDTAESGAISSRSTAKPVRRTRRRSARRTSGSVIVAGVKRLQAGGQVALERIGGGAGQHDLAHRQRVGVVARSRGSCPAASACPAGRARARPGAGCRAAPPDRRACACGPAGRRRAPVRSCAVGLLARPSRGSRARAGRRRPGALGDALVAQAGEQVVGGRDALAERLRDLVGADAVGGAGEQPRDAERGACGAQPTM